ncbi:PrsW family intramembrane metalloprotease [Formosa algae]|uniref:Protease PrsW n=1 Tax=Formosa algae TaxID=225843 RepID=A0A9X0YP77_9FLAO|nr:PrsW family glutamic-type intramembrane protease [Formosa algae]MBP1841094.1 RsiW-degrading membrane proteinase PrsW (M82 family) [Formosa algae]MDQ0336486.1 RsiW-degrading membrane proteinase PrsW (M82 family) [Formosa algae]OEI81540.1 branched-chain amino acid aminotransferase [Formosa algae]PNW26603.1 protease PrsW [Formosa algae]
MNLLLLALAPIVVVIVYIYNKDIYEKEPKILLFYNFILGAFVSVIITTIISIIYNYILVLNDGSVLHQFIRAFLVVGLTEEFSKYVIVRYFAQPNKAFNEPFDGIMYAVMVSMGFAATENLFYVFQGGITSGITRAFTAVPAHAMFGILMGYFMGKAKFSKHKIRYNLIGLCLAMCFHGSYDFFLFIDFIPGIWAGAFISLILGFWLSIKAIKNHQEKSYFK